MERNIEKNIQNSSVMRYRVDISDASGFIIAVLANSARSIVHLLLWNQRSGDWVQSNCLPWQLQSI